METRNCQNCKKDFTIDQDDFSFYEKMKVPPPTFCPECRMIRRFSYRNERRLFRRPDYFTGLDIFSGYAPESPVKTIKNSTWFGTDWYQLETGVEYDFSKNFFSQFKELMTRAPIPALSSAGHMLNSDYCNEASYLKNCYLCFNMDYGENTLYARRANHLKDSMDLFECNEDEMCYENVMVDKSYNTFYSLDCESCVDVWFSKGLRGCTHCFGSMNLKNKSYYYFNEPCTKDEYFEKIKNFDSSSYSAVQGMFKKAKDFWQTLPNKYYHGLRILNSTGERIYDSKNVRDSYSVREGENLRYCQDMQPTSANSYDYSVWGAGSENMYECMTCGVGSYNVKFSSNCWEDTRDIEYCMHSIGCKNCFGCVGLYKKEYCILNKQYSKEEYFVMRDKIIKQMNDLPYIDALGRTYKYGEFFPSEISPVGYNYCLANDFFPLNQTEANQNGFNWIESHNREFAITLPANKIPDSSKNISEDIQKEIIGCENCNKAFKIVGLEFSFYKKFNLPIPRLCQDCRFSERFKFMNPPKLWHRKCMNDGCQNEFETSYSPDRPEIVYCESCYQQEVV